MTDFDTHRPVLSMLQWHYFKKIFSINLYYPDS